VTAGPSGSSPSGQTIVPRWEWRTFGQSFGEADARFAALRPERAEESDEVYVLSMGSDASVKVRNGLMDVKQLQTVNEDGLEQWKPVMKAEYPLPAEEVLAVLETLAAEAPPLARSAYTLDQLVDEVVGPSPDLLAVAVHKQREHYTVGGCMAERSEIRTEQGARRTIAVESEDPARVIAAVRDLGLSSRRNVCLARGLKALVGFGSRRYAVIDVGTNSVKFHIGERETDGDWTTIADRAEVTRLGEGLDEAGKLGERPIERTVEAIAAMADEARRSGVEEIAAVGTAGLRIAPNSAALVDAVRDRTGIEVEVIPGEEEGRLAYIAVKSGLGLGRGSLVVFDTGGGSSQFTFGRGEEVDERFSVNVGATRFTERYGLDGAVSEDALASAMDAIATGLAPLDGRPTPDTLVGMGGAITNLTAVKHGLAEYDPTVVQGTVLDLAEIDRQIELYRSRTADERRQIVGLQPKRAEVILAGASIVRTVVTKLGRESLTVSDHGLRHGLLLERFGDAAGRAASSSLRGST
jgi:exopolyphosphatase/guanosine-5'-triphosphate,3'-diphosphate pyrophosphatase